MTTNFQCLSRCRSPGACKDFGYCRERNNDGCPMDEENIARRRRESDAAIRALAPKVEG